MKGALPILLAAGCELPLPLPSETGTGTTTTDTTAPDDETDDPAPVGELELLTYEGQSRADGTFEVVVGVEPGMTAFQITAVSQEYPGLEALYDPSGALVLHWTDWFYSPNSLTNASRTTSSPPSTGRSARRTAPSRKARGAWCGRSRTPTTTTCRSSR
jgi:hypothetical protein